MFYLLQPFFVSRVVAGENGSCLAVFEARLAEDASYPCHRQAHLTRLQHFVDILLSP